LVLKDVASLLDNNPYIDSTTLINFDDSAQEIVKIADSFNQYNIDLTINLQSTNFSTKVLKKISSRWKINRSYYFRDKFTDVLVGFANTYRSVIDRDLDILRSIGLEPVDKFTEVFPAEDEVAWAKRFFSENGLSRDKKTVIVHPCSSLAIRSWGIEKFALVCKNLISEDHCQIIINCSPKELDSVAPINNLAPEVCVFSGSLRELLALINEADLFVGNDSGPSQFSAALNIPTITMNGPSTSSIYRDPDLFQGQHYTFNKEVHCRDLFHSQCMLKTDPVTNHPVCDEMICLDFTVEEVTLKAQELLKLSGKRNPE
ncbi:MAG: glycosyltransferase family 9 protein, partial [Nitrospinaceae bacterium]|nr:glycosyltransferase family 9 protein [Nitrospinaceae bacterium]